MEYETLSALRLGVYTSCAHKRVCRAVKKDECHCFDVCFAAPASQR